MLWKRKKCGGKSIPAKGSKGSSSFSLATFALLPSDEAGADVDAASPFFLATFALLPDEADADAPVDDAYAPVDAAGAPVDAADAPVDAAGRLRTDRRPRNTSSL